MTTDIRGNPLSCDAETARRLDAAFVRFHTYHADPVADLDAIIAAQPDCAMAHATRASIIATADDRAF